MRHDQLLPVQPGEERGAYVKRMRDEFGKDVPLDELVDCAKSWWDKHHRLQVKLEILREIEIIRIAPHSTDQSVLVRLLERIVKELL